jgi:tight adherence protein B
MGRTVPASVTAGLAVAAALVLLGLRAALRGMAGRRRSPSPSPVALLHRGLRTVRRGLTATARRGQAEAALLGVVDGLAAEVAAGATLDEAAARVASTCSPAPLREALLGVDGSGLQATADEPLAERVRNLAANDPADHHLAWLATALVLAARTGIPASGVLDVLAGSLRDVRDHHQAVRTATAGPRASIRLLAGLPVLGLAAGQLAGGEPLSFLLRSPPGWGCLVMGGLLEAAGIRWTSRLVSAAEEGR